MCHLGRGGGRLAGEQHCTTQPSPKKHKFPLEHRHHSSESGNNCSPLHLQPRWAACPGPPFQTKLFCTPGFRAWGSCAVSCEIRITHGNHLQSALYPALLGNLEGSMSNQSCQCKSDGLLQIKLLQGLFFLSWARKKLVLLFCVTSSMFYFFCKKHLHGMKDVKILAVLKAPQNVTSSAWIMTQPHLDI